MAATAATPAIALRLRLPSGGLQLIIWPGSVSRLARRPSLHVSNLQPSPHSGGDRDRPLLSLEAEGEHHFGRRLARTVGFFARLLRSACSSPPGRGHLGPCCLSG